MTGPDPNEGSIDPMEPEYWKLGEDVQDRIAASGHDSETVVGIAVDIHDILQSAERIRHSLAPAVVDAKTPEELQAALHALSFEFGHLHWHGANGRSFLDDVTKTLK